MNINDEVMKASRIMARYGVIIEDQAAVVKTLLNAGLEHCLAEQERIVQAKEAMIERVDSGAVVGETRVPQREMVVELCMPGNKVSEEPWSVN